MDSYLLFLNLAVSATAELPPGAGMAAAAEQESAELQEAAVLQEAAAAGKILAKMDYGPLPAVESEHVESDFDSGDHSLQSPHL